MYLLSLPDSVIVRDFGFSTVGTIVSLGIEFIVFAQIGILLE